MRILYDKWKNKKVNYGTHFGFVCGYTPTTLVIAMETSPPYSFRKFGKEEHYITEEYKDSKYRYAYALESTLEKEYPNDVQRDFSKV